MCQEMRSVVAGLVAILTACTPFSPPRVFPPEAEFPGFMEYPNATVIMMHGMCHHDEEWIRHSLKQFRKHLKLTGADAVVVWQSKEANGVKLYKTELTGPNNRVRFYAIVFSGVTQPIKQNALCANVSSKTASCDFEPLYNRPQAAANRILKNGLMNECLSDAVIYLGSTGREIRAGVRGAIAYAADDTRQQPAYSDAPTVLIAESLGSKILADSIFCQPGKAMRLVDKQRVLDRQVVEDLITHQLATTTQVFLLANQIPLLNLAFDGETCTVPAAYRSLEKTVGKLGTFQAFIEWINNNKRDLPAVRAKATRAGENADVVAFTDPNDVLSYELSKDDLDVAGLTNIAVSNGLTLLWLLENPYTAHTTYSGNRDVIDFMGCGKAKDSLRARQCRVENDTNP